jgi:hypothetical protein
MILLCMESYGKTKSNYNEANVDYMRHTIDTDIRDKKYGIII